jgi:CRISPR/Cas system-associated protein Cas10 (large subunit of type III CRISPR-Cas system)
VKGEYDDMPDLAALMLKRSVVSLRSDSSRCSGCRRTPLAGESMHEMDNGRELCELCLALVPEADRHAVRTQKVHTGDRHISVAPRAA